MQTHSVYLHNPFCRQRCTYCDFNTYAGLDSIIPDYAKALCQEIDYLGKSSATQTSELLPVHTIYFGGGTPSLIPTVSIGTILEKLANSFDLHHDVEITIEANPGTVTIEALRSLHAMGVNRLSLGAQSAHPEELLLLGRIHNFKDVIQAMENARGAKFEVISLDLIFGLPHQTLQAWQHSLDQVIELEPDHLSLYALTVEHGTPLQKQISRGYHPTPDPDLAADLYEWATERLEQANYRQYEISNWAKSDTNGKDFTCRHNLQYWRSLPYLGLGAGAHGYTHDVRTANVISPQAYIHRCLHSSTTMHVLRFPRTPATAHAHKIDCAMEMSETMIMGLRLTHEGVSDVAFLQRFGQSLHEVYGKHIDRLIQQGLLEWHEEDVLRLTPKGRLLGNQVFIEFV
jgi:oxygen-independent coproporphyrinogen-3 oxidase